MILGLEYDISLWLILKNDSKNRSLILDLIKSIPDDIYKEILNKINKYKNGMMINLYKELKVKNNFYFFSINKEDGSIIIGKSASKKIENNDIFILKLYPFNSSNNSFVGEFTYQVIDPEKGKIVDCDKIKYKLVRFLSSLYFKIDPYYLYSISDMFRKLDIDKLPTSINIKTLENISFENHLKKKKKKF